MYTCTVGEEDHKRKVFFLLLLRFCSVDFVFVCYVRTCSVWVTVCPSTPII